MDDPRPLYALLSPVLVAFTIECDNEVEHRLPHRTTIGGRTTNVGPTPYLVSLVMWLNGMQYVGPDGITVRALGHRARTVTNLNGLARWGYVQIAPDPADPRSNPPRSAWLIRATAGGRMAQEVWRPLIGEIEERWSARLGAEAITELRAALIEIVDRLRPGLPDGLPILRFGLFTPSLVVPDVPIPLEVTAALPLVTLVSRVLCAFTLEYEAGSPVSLAVGATLLQALDGGPVALRDLPALTGTSREAINMGIGFLDARGLAVVEHDPSGPRTKVARLTPAGAAAFAAHRRRAASVEARWREALGAPAITRLRTDLATLTGAGDLETSPLVAGLTPFPFGWRASVPAPRVLPEAPLVLHRGGYPDGS